MWSIARKCGFISSRSRSLALALALGLPLYFFVIFNHIWNFPKVCAFIRNTNTLENRPHQSILCFCFFCFMLLLVSIFVTVIILNRPNNHILCVKITRTNINKSNCVWILRCAMRIPLPLSPFHTNETKRNGAYLIMVKVHTAPMFIPFDVFGGNCFWFGYSLHGIPYLNIYVYVLSDQFSGTRMFCFVTIWTAFAAALRSTEFLQFHNQLLPCFWANWIRPVQQIGLLYQV